MISVRDQLIRIDPYYVADEAEIRIFAQSNAKNLAVMLKGPAGCVNTRFAGHMARRLRRPLSTFACHEDLTTSGLGGRFMIRPGGKLGHDMRLPVQCAQAWHDLVDARFV